MDELVAIHLKEFGTPPDVITSAPGIVNIVGEHTDYSDGFVLQASLDRRAWIALSKRSDTSLRFFAADFNERKRTTIANLKYKREDRWANYVKGVLYELLQLGFTVGGLNCTIHSTIPQGIGLGSSAAIEVAAAVAVRNLFGLDMTRIQVMQSASLAESAFIGLHSEITDQLVSTISREGMAVFLDLRTLRYEYVPLVFEGAKLLVTISNVPNAPVDSELDERRQQCAECVQYLQKRKAGTALRDYTPSDLKNSMGVVPENIRRLCLHVVEENQRVMEARQFMETGNLEGLGKVLYRSHESLRDNFEVSCPELDWLVKRALEIDGVYGSRMTGSGFGGCTVTLLRDDAFGAYSERLDEYERIFGFKAETFVCIPTDGAGIRLPG